MRPTVAILHHPHSLFPMAVFEQVRDHVDLVWVLNEDFADDRVTHRLTAKLGTVVDSSGLDAQDTAKLLANVGVTGVVTFVDAHLVRVAEIAAELGLPGHTPQAAAVLVDKALQREAMSAAGVPGPVFWAIPAGTSKAQLLAIGEQVPYPAVVKPTEGSGSRGIDWVRNCDELFGLLGPDGRVPIDWVVEEFLDRAPPATPWQASYLSVESVVSHGRAIHVAITGRFPIAEPFRECGNFLPAQLPDTVTEEQLFAMADAAISALQVTDAVLHTEIQLTSRGPRLIEVNGRLGGRPPFVLRSVSEANLFAAACLVSAGCFDPASVGLTTSVATTGVGFWLMIQPPMEATTITAVRGLQEANDLAGVDLVISTAQPGQAVDWRRGTDAKVVIVRGISPDHESLGETIAAIRSTVQIDYA